MLVYAPDSFICWNCIFAYSSPRVHTLLHGLSPGFLRFGGTVADMTVFTDEPPDILKDINIKPELVPMNSELKT